MSENPRFLFKRFWNAIFDCVCLSLWFECQSDSMLEYRSLVYFFPYSFVE
ncbi:hypothetical protein APHDU1_0737 [Anaplasma phagocytophilum]|nr:hypothetical protein APHWEB_0540 [Anaplasma phagocytophilum str. Webster]KJV99810.1 hypothetical protein OTSANNIE_0152 [Anaplasma phagocytophilum str. Annie]KJZ99940.1 hypothetical protein APHDU1_0737 [Anaplasma phagocytophilum]